MYLGLAYASLPTGNRTENLKNAISYYENALTIYTKEAYPEWWAKTQLNLGLTYISLAEHTGEPAYLQQARDAWEQAREGFRSIGLSQEAKVVEELLGEIEKLP